MTILNEKESNAPVSRVLYPTPPCGRANGASVIYLLRRLPGGSSILPSIARCEPYPHGEEWLPTRTDSPRSMVYANLQPPDGTARQSPADWWSLTPPSHPYPNDTFPQGNCIKNGAVVLFFRILPLPATGTFTSGASCAARTFLSCPLGTSDRPWHCFHDAKVRRRKQKAKKIFGFFSTSSYLCTQFIK